MLVGIAAPDIEHVWAKVAPILQMAIDKSQNDYALHDIRGLLHNRDMQLWVWYDGIEIVACLITQIQNYPHRRVCQLPFIAGRKMRDWLAVEPTIVAWAKENGCSQLEGFCRPGWTRILKDWRTVWHTMRKDI